jgi:hypothetical protein
VQQLLSEGAVALPPEAAAQAQALWARADAYYYRNIARVQRLWQVGLPSAGVTMGWHCSVSLVLRHALRDHFFLGGCALVTACPAAVHLARHSLMK